MAKGDIISRLKLESGEFDAKIKRAGQELLAYSDHCRKMGLEMGYANRDAKEFAKQLGSMATVSQTARGKINELSEAFVNAKVMYKNMTDEEKKGEFGRNLAKSLDQLKVRLNDAKKDLADVQSELNGSKFGQFGNVLDTIGNKLGLTTNATELLTNKTALMYAGIGAGVAIIGKATDAWAKYNAELARQDQITTVTTGLKGDDANRMTDTMRALSDTYKVDFREAINAANTLMSQFGVTGDEAISLIKDGMKGMIMGDGPKLLSMIQQYAPAFQSAGVSASQLVAVIHNSEGGIFTDQNMNAIVMGIKNIRLMTKATSEALAKLGLDGQDMAKKMNDGTMTVFDALKLVAAQLRNVDSNSQAAGEVMQTVFGRQGAMAGTNLGKAIDTLNTNLEDTKKQLGDVGDAYEKLQEANERLNVAIRDAFGYDGWEQMATGIKTTLIGALSDVIEHLAIIEEGFGKIKNFFGGGGGNKGGGIGYEDIEKTQKWINNGKDDDERRRRYDKAIADLQKKLNKIGQEYSVKNADGSTSFKIDDAETQARKRAALEKRMQMLYATKYTPEPEVVKPITPTTPKTSHTTTPSEQAAKAVESAEQEYARQLEMAALELKGGKITEAQQKQKQLTATEALWAAYGKASDTVKGTNADYIARQKSLGEEIVKLGGETTKLVEAQKKAQEAARQLEQTQKKVSDALTEAADAYSRNDLKGYIAAQKKVGGDAGQGITAGGFSYTSGNMDAFTEQLKDKLSQADLGSTLYQNLTAQLADATTLANLMQVAVKNGIDTAQFNPQELWKKVFSDNPGDYIEDSTWEEIRTKLEEIIGKPIKIDLNTGEVKKDVKAISKTASVTADVVGSIGQAFNAIEDPAAKVVGTVAQAIANVALGYSEALKMAKETGGPWAWIAFAATGLATMITTISSIHSATGYAHGGVIKDGFSGIVPGNSYSGDNIPANNGHIMLNSGETVLNVGQSQNVASALIHAMQLADSVREMPAALDRAQQMGPASQIYEREGGGGLRIVGMLKGEDVVLMADRWGMRTGRGELLFGRNL